MGRSERWKWTWRYLCTFNAVIRRLASSQNINLKNVLKMFLFIFLITEAIQTIIQFMGMQPCEWTDKLPEGKNTHVLLLAGVYRGGHDVLVRAKLAFNDGGVAMQLTIRSSDGTVPQVIAQAVG